MRASLTKWGNSLALRVPKEIAASVGLREGAPLDLTVENGALVLRRRRYDLDELVAAMAGKDQPLMELDDEPRGSEVW